MFDNIVKSASKIVLILMTLATIAALFTGRVKEDTFKIVLVMVFTYYFTKKEYSKTK